MTRGSASQISRAARKAPVDEEPPPQQLEAAARAPGGLEARLAGVVVAALKEAFDRDTRRLDLERQQLEAERERAERALRLELQRQAGEREIGRMRLLAGVAGAAWLGTLLLVARLIGSIGARVALGFGWLFLLGAIAASFTAQSAIAAAIDAQAAGDDRQADPIRRVGRVGAVADDLRPGAGRPRGAAHCVQRRDAEPAESVRLRACESLDRATHGLRHPHVPHPAHVSGRRAHAHEDVKRDGCAPYAGARVIGHRVAGDVAADADLEPAPIARRRARRRRVSAVTSLIVSFCENSSRP